MTDDQVKQVVASYRERLEREGYSAHRIDFDRTTAAFPKSRQLEHVAWLCGEILEALAAGERERAMRHFGFAQGVLWVHGLYAVSELKEQNRAAPK
jgi:predicted DNA-binding transcriptional regulator AlpA